MVTADDTTIALASVEPFESTVMPVRRLLGYLRRAGTEWGPTALAVAIILALWAILTSAGVIKFYVLPTPSAVASAFADNLTLLWNASLTTAEEAAAGFAIGNSIGILMAVGFLYIPSFEKSWYPLVLISQGIPMVALIPVFILLLGIGTEPKIAVAAFACVAPTLLNVRRGLRSADAEASELLYTLSATGLQRLIKVRIPSSLPYLFASFQVTVGRALISAMVAEWVSSTAGIGWLIQVFASQYDVPQLWAAVVAATLLCLVAFGIVRAIEHYATRWRRVGTSGI